MSLPKSIIAYKDCQEIYEKAMDSVNAGGQGIRVRQESYGAAVYLRMRMNQARAINRRDNAEIYAPGDPLYMASEWDALIVTIKTADDVHYLYVESNLLDVSNIEEIPESDEAKKASPPQEHLPVGIAQPLITRR